MTCFSTCEISNRRLHINFLQKFIFYTQKRKCVQTILTHSGPQFVLCPFNVEKDRSPLQLVTIKDKYIRSVINIFGKAVSSAFLVINLNIWNSLICFVSSVLEESEEIYLFQRAISKPVSDDTICRLSLIQSCY